MDSDAHQVGFFSWRDYKPKDKWAIKTKSDIKIEYKKKKDRSHLYNLRKEVTSTKQFETSDLWRGKLPSFRHIIVLTLLCLTFN